MATQEAQERRRVVVTGIGAISALGFSAQENFQNLVDGKTGLSSLPFEHPTIKLAGQIKNFDLKTVFSAFDDKRLKETNRLPRAAQIGQAAMQEALQSADLLDDHSLLKDPSVAEDFPVYQATAIGGGFDLDILEGKSKIHIIQTLPDTVASGPGRIFGLRGTYLTPMAACAGGGEAIGIAFRFIRDGYNDIAIAGGAESGITPRHIDQYDQIHALSLSDDPERASLPFDVDASGFVMAEAGAALILESEEHAVRRGAQILAEVKWFESGSDAYHPTSGDGSALRKTMRRVRKVLGEVDGALFVQAHATGTKGDLVEGKVIEKVLEDDREKVVYAYKRRTGHPLGVAGVYGAFVTIYTLNEGVVPPNNVEHPVKEFAFELPREAVQRKFAAGMSNSLGFGGDTNTLGFVPYVPR
ncbi:MAG: beta-ketoacyl-[acyl-carrier-protein] synthase family protein [Candidatus Levybacteria bacterium]|nr:beta-ketoacyl-[acyl-carrier-protein] synthase family protein [Candidatus Levybacteria bacterium]